MIEIEMWGVWGLKDICTISLIAPLLVTFYHGRPLLLLWRRPAGHTPSATCGSTSSPPHRPVRPHASRTYHRTPPRFRPLSLSSWPRRRQSRPVHVLCLLRCTRQAPPPRSHDARQLWSCRPSSPLQGPHLGPLRRRPRRARLPLLRGRRVRHRLGRLFRR